MANTYDVGDLVECAGAFTDEDGTAVNPTAVAFIVRDADGNETGYKYGFSSQGTWNAATNTPALADGTGTAGHYYTVSTAGSRDFGDGSMTFAVGDYVFYDGYHWSKLPDPSATAITKDSTGNYSVQVPITRHPGTWYYRFEGCGTPTGKSGGEGSFIVRTSHVDAL